MGVGIYDRRVTPPRLPRSCRNHFRGFWAVPPIDIWGDLYEARHFLPSLDSISRVSIRRLACLAGTHDRRGGTTVFAESRRSSPRLPSPYMGRFEFASRRDAVPIFAGLVFRLGMIDVSSLPVVCLAPMAVGVGERIYARAAPIAPEQSKMQVPRRTCPRKCVIRPIHSTKLPFRQSARCH